MRNFIACLLLLGLLAGLSACGADDSYLSVRTHVEPSIPATETPQQEEPPTAGNRSELRGAMLSFVRNWTEQGEIRISGYSGDLTADLTETVRYITQEDPIGAYAVDYADAELRGDAQTGTVEVSIVFRRSAAEIDAIVTVSGVNGAHAKIRQALANFDAALTLRIRSYEDADFSGYIRTYCLEHPDSAMALPEVSAAVYPETGETRILELHFTYSQPRDTLRSMQAAVNTILDSAAGFKPQKYDRACMKARLICVQTEIIPLWRCDLGKKGKLAADRSRDLCDRAGVCRRQDTAGGRGGGNYYHR